MVPTILVIGATGNTGKSVVRNRSELVKGKGYRNLGLTRSLQNVAAKELAKLTGVGMQEKDWTEIDTAWLKKRDVVKAYIAPHNGPSQFVEESGLHLALLNSGVHQPEYKNLQWSSFQPNFFTITYLAAAANWIKEYQKTGKQTILKVVLDADANVAMIDPEDLGLVGAHLLALDDPTPPARYVLSGPEDVNDRGIVKLVEKVIGNKVDKSSFRDTEWVHNLAQDGTFPPKVVPSILAGFDCLWDGRCSLSGTPTSKPVLELASPKRTIEDALKLRWKE